MIYTKRAHLTVIELSEEREFVAFEELIPALMERLSQVVYVELQGVLWGIVSESRIIRAVEQAKNYVNINRQFKYVPNGGYMQAKRFFENRVEMTYLPILDEDGHLLGEYRRNDRLTYQECFMPYFASLYASEVCKIYRRIILVKPHRSFARKQRLFLKMKKILELNDVAVEEVEPQELFEKEPSEFDGTALLTVTPEDRSGINILQCMLTLKSDTFLVNEIFTYDFFEDIRTRFSHRLLKSEIGAKLRQLQEEGVYILTLHFTENENGYLEKLHQTIQNRCAKLGIKGNYLPHTARKDFFGELFDEEYAEQLFPLPYTIVRKDNDWEIKDVDTRFFHAQDGDRLTEGQPVQYERCLYLYGPCIIIGTYVEDKYTIASWLQNHINNNGIPCRVFNKGMNITYMDELRKISLTPLKKGDIVVLCMDSLYFKGLDDLNLADVLEKNAASANWFANSEWHCNYKVNKLYADAIFEKLGSILKTPAPDRKLVESLCVSDFYISKYFSDFNPSTHGVIGSIVMNCNPFTLGHRWLIEEAQKRVDFLIIFVVEEDRSVFTFEERLTMVYNGVSDLNNVKIVPSGENILSQKTFPEYFVKVEDEHLVENVEQDITIFAEQIAPRLNIFCRFVGEEPEDSVTNSYNTAMKKILPAYGVDIIEIPRKELDGEVISASRVRRSLEENDRVALEKLLPQSTIQILFSENE